MTEEQRPRGKRGRATDVVHLGRDPKRHLGAVNTPVYRATTILFDTVAELEAAERGEYPGFTYGLHGLPTVTDLQAAMAQLEGGYAALAVPSGLAAITLALLGTTRAGDHVLVTDAVYGPTRRFCDNQLKLFGVEVSYYDPLAGAAVEREFRPNTRLVFTESPGSLTFEVQDVPAIAAVAHAKGALVMLDNTWATPLGFRVCTWRRHLVARGYEIRRRPLDVLVGLITCNEATFPRCIVGGLTWSRSPATTLFRAARLARRRSPRAAHAKRVDNRALVARAAGSPGGDLPRAPRLARPRVVAARLQRRLRAVRRDSEARGQGARRCDARRLAAVPDGLELGRFRKPDHSRQCRAREAHDPLATGGPACACTPD